MSSLRRSIDLHGQDDGVLLHYKERLVAYLERFLNHLMTVSEDVADALQRIESHGTGRLLGLAARHELADRLDASDADLARAEAAWR
jgi:hypothetical protein